MASIVACRCHDIRISTRRFEVLELDVQVIHDMEFRMFNLSIDT